MYLNVSMELESTTSPYTWVIIYSTLLIILACDMEQIKKHLNLHRLRYSLLLLLLFFTYDAFARVCSITLLFFLVPL